MVVGLITHFVSNARISLPQLGGWDAHCELRYIYTPGSGTRKLVMSDKRLHAYSFVGLLVLALVGPGLAVPNGVMPTGPLNIGYYEVCELFMSFCFCCDRSLSAMAPRMPPQQMKLSLVHHAADMGRQRGVQRCKHGPRQYTRLVDCTIRAPWPQDSSCNQNRTVLRRTVTTTKNWPGLPFRVCQHHHTELSTARLHLYQGTGNLGRHRLGLQVSVRV